MPRPESIEFFQTAIPKHDHVLSVERLGSQVFRVTRDIAPTELIVLLINLYTVGLADVVRAMTEVEGLNCIVTISAWNGYTEEAKQYALNRKIGLFIFREIMGALGKRHLWKYVKLDENGKPDLPYMRKSS